MLGALQEVVGLVVGRVKRMLHASVFERASTTKDAGGGWGMDLRVQCKQYEQLWGKTKVVIGSSHYNETPTVE